MTPNNINLNLNETNDKAEILQASSDTIITLLKNKGYGIYFERCGGKLERHRVRHENVSLREKKLRESRAMGFGSSPSTAVALASTSVSAINGKACVHWLRGVPSGLWAGAHPALVAVAQCSDLEFYHENNRMSDCVLKAARQMLVASYGWSKRKAPDAKTPNRTASWSNSIFENIFGDPSAFSSDNQYCKHMSSSLRRKRRKNEKAFLMNLRCSTID